MTKITEFPTSEYVLPGNRAVDCGLVVLYEVEDGVFRLNGTQRIAREGRHAAHARG
ncbi:MAG: hypothetical protein WBI63_07440 [Coriobacteriia bacterium]